MTPLVAEPGVTHPSDATDYIHTCVKVEKFELSVFCSIFQLVSHGCVTTVGRAVKGLI